MQIRFWRDRRPWRPVSTHQSAPNPLLERHWSGLRLEHGSTVFVPMCGKSDDLRWLLGQGHQGLGIELADLAIEAYFEEAGEPYEREDSDRLVRYRGPRTDILCGDFFALTAADLSAARAVLDRGALIALPPKMRARFVDHLLRVVPDRTDILLVTLEYDQNLVAGPPFSVLPEEVVSHFGARCSIVPLESSRTELLPPKFAAQGVDCAAETAYHIVKQE
ncbi:MAG: thiopurine S-methyltransferase [Pseudomonadales bacterium]|nr:thiopurine S-methyltransferase [Pseudomonadales bacterium]NIX08418.1 thiopurine S-methyltransferase [Pseudomonadales bacterium]